MAEANDQRAITNGSKGKSIVLSAIEQIEIPSVFHPMENIEAMKPNA